MQRLAVVKTASRHVIQWLPVPTQGSEILKILWSHPFRLQTSWLKMLYQRRRWSMQWKTPYGAYLLSLWCHPNPSPGIHGLFLSLFPHTIISIISLIAISMVHTVIGFQTAAWHLLNPLPPKSVNWMTWMRTAYLTLHPMLASVIQPVNQETKSPAGLQSSRFTVICVTKGSVQSNHVGREQLGHQETGKRHLSLMKRRTISPVMNWVHHVRRLMERKTLFRIQTTQVTQSPENHVAREQLSLTNNWFRLRTNSKQLATCQCVSDLIWLFLSDWRKHKSKFGFR